MRKSKKKLFLIIISAAVLFLAAAVLIYFGIRNYNTAGYVNGMRVDSREIQLIFTENRREAEQYFESKYSIEASDDAFWDTVFDEGTPKEYLENLIWDELVSLKAEQELFYEYNLCYKFDYNSFLKDLEKENRKRQEAKENGDVFYGPEQFDEKDFYDYLQNNYRIALQRLLESELTEADEEILIEYYEATKDSKYQKGSEWQIGIIAQSGEENQASSLLEYQSMFQAGMSIQDFRDTYALQIHAGQLHYSEMTVSEGKKMLTVLEKKYLEKLEVMQANETALIEADDGWQLIVCLHKEENGYYQFDEVKGNVQGDLFQLNYEEKIEESAKRSLARRTDGFYRTIEEGLK